MRPRECSDEDIRQAREIVMRINLLTTSRVHNVDRSAFQLSRILEVDIRSDEERITFQNRVATIRSESNERTASSRQSFSVYSPIESSSSSINSGRDRLKRSA